MKANLPAFGDVPSGLKVMLVDVPGLGDGNMSITQVALESAKISSAYIYLCHYQHFDDSSDFDAIGLLHQKDKGHNYIHLLFLVLAGRVGSTHCWCALVWYQKVR